MSDVSASIGISQIKKLNQFVLKRNKIAQFYEKFLDKKFLILPTKNKNYLSSYHLYVIKIRDEYKFFHEKTFSLYTSKIVAKEHTQFYP